MECDDGNELPSAKVNLRKRKNGSDFNWKKKLAILIAGAGLLAVFFLPELNAIFILKKREVISNIMADKGRSNLESEVVRTQISGHKFDIPMRYFYWEAFVKHGYWPEASNTRTIVEAASLSFLLPDLRPYQTEDETRWKESGWGEKLQVSIMQPMQGSELWFQSMRERYLTGKEPGTVIRNPDEHGLISFDEARKKTYFPLDSAVELIISCNSRKEIKFPSCHIKSNYKPGLVIEYSFGIEHLIHWREIDKALKEAFDNFEKAADSDFTNNEILEGPWSFPFS